MLAVVMPLKHVKKKNYLQKTALTMLMKFKGFNDLKVVKK